MKRDLNWLKAKADIRIGCFDMVSMGYAIEMYNEDQLHIEKLEKEIASLKELIIQATPYVEYAVKYSTQLSQKLSEEWLEKTQTRREK